MTLVARRVDSGFEVTRAREKATDLFHPPTVQVAYRMVQQFAPLSHCAVRLQRQIVPSHFRPKGVCPGAGTEREREREQEIKKGCCCCCCYRDS